MQNRKRIFIIDTEVDLCLLMKTYFLRKNYEVFISHSADDAFSQVKECQPDIILLSSTACKNPDRDIEKIKEAAPDAELRINTSRPFEV